MKILFFAGGAYVGGMENVTLTLMKELSGAGHQAMAIVSGWNDGVYPVKLAEAGIPFRCLKLGRIYRSKPLWTLISLLYFPHEAIALRRIIKSFKPDVIIQPDLGLAFTTLKALPQGTPRVLHVHSMPNQHYASVWGRSVVRHCVGVIAVSNFVASALFGKSVPEVMVRTVHNGVLEPKLVTKPPCDRVRLAIVGRLSLQKRHDVLVSAIGLLDEQTQQLLEVRIYGAESTEYAMNIRHRIEESNLKHVFRWMGFVATEKIYQEVDILVAPAVDEAFGMTVSEAGVFGIPVISARSGGFPEIVIDGQTGLMFTPDDPVELAKAIHRLVYDGELRARMGESGRNHIRCRFTPKHMATNFVNALRSFRIPG